MNRIKYFQQGGSTPASLDDKAVMQAILQGDPQTIQQLIQTALKGDELAKQIILVILQENKKGNPNVAKAAQVINQLLQQTPISKYGSKLNYIRSLKYANGGKTCPSCQKGGMPVTSDKAYIKSNKKIEEKACGGKAKKRYFGGWL